MVGGVEIRGGRTDTNSIVAVFGEFEFEAEDEVGIGFLRLEVAASVADEIAVLDGIAVDTALPDFRAKRSAVEEEFESELFLLRRELVEGLSFLSLKGIGKSENACGKRSDEKLFHGAFSLNKRGTPA